MCPTCRGALIGASGHAVLVASDTGGGPDNRAGKVEYTIPRQERADQRGEQLRVGYWPPKDES
jgi:hypothetical protein